MVLIPSVALGWIAFGAVAVVVMRRRGHDTFEWVLLFLFLGPLALPLAVSSDRHRPAQPDRPLAPGGLDILVFDDGSSDSAVALESALNLLGPRISSITLGAVVGMESPTTVVGREAQEEIRERLDRRAQEVGAGLSVPVATVILFGEPGHAHQEFAREKGYGLVVASAAAAGHWHFGRPRSAPAGMTAPVLIGPAPA